MCSSCHKWWYGILGHQRTLLQHDIHITNVPSVWPTLAEYDADRGGVGPTGITMMTSSNRNIFRFICAGNSPVTREFPTQSSATRSFDVFFDLHLNKRLRKQSIGWWSETPSRPFWRYCNGSAKGHNYHACLHKIVCLPTTGSRILVLSQTQKGKPHTPIRVSLSRQQGPQIRGIRVGLMSANGNMRLSSIAWRVGEKIFRPKMLEPPIPHRCPASASLHKFRSLVKWQFNCISKSNLISILYSIMAHRFFSGNLLNACHIPYEFRKFEVLKVKWKLPFV